MNTDENNSQLDIMEHLCPVVTLSPSPSWLP